MATAVQIAAQTTLEEYLHTTYHPDCEYIDGNIEERNVGKWQHARLQWLIAAWFDRHQREWSCIGSTEQRIRISPTRIRIPDLVILPTSRPPDVLVDPPLLIIEILSPEDTYTSLEKRAADYRTMGVQNIWIIDPETRTARTILNDSWIAATRLEVPSTPIFVELDYLFARLDDETA